MGLLAVEEKRPVVDDIVLVKQQVSPGTVDLDMEWWADKQVELFDQRGIHPWQSSLWIHTHPSGMAEPSMVDEETMEKSFGGWTFAGMLILTKDGKFYARMDFNHEFAPGIVERFNASCDVQILWSNVGQETIGRETLELWEKEFLARVTETQSTFPSRPLRPQENRWILEDEREMGIGESDMYCQTNGKEVTDYVGFCRNSGAEPEDPEMFELYFGYSPEPEDFFEIQSVVRSAG